MVVRNSSVEDVFVSCMKVSNALLFDRLVEMIGYILDGIGRS